MPNHSRQYFLTYIQGKWNRNTQNYTKVLCDRDVQPFCLSQVSEGWECSWRNSFTSVTQGRIRLLFKAAKNPGGIGNIYHGDSVVLHLHMLQAPSPAPRNQSFSVLPYHIWHLGHPCFLTNCLLSVVNIFYETFTDFKSLKSSVV